MMLLLLGDVIQHGLFQRGTHAERRVADLPGKCSKRRERLMNPTGGICLYGADDFSGSKFCGKDCKNMNMIGRSIRQQWIRIQFTKNSAQVGEQSIFEVWFESWRTALRAENNVRQEIGVCVCHCLTPLRGSSVSLILLIPRLTPWAAFSRRSAPVTPAASGNPPEV